MMISISPKLRRPPEESLYRYCAGYSYGFVREVLSTYEVERGDLVVDAWSGTGLTSVIAKEFGGRSIGIDISPVMTTIARANNMPRELPPSFLTLK